MRIKNFYYPVLSALALLLCASCSSGVSEDMHTLLGNVPRESGAIMAINLEKSIEQAGGKVSGGKIKEVPGNSDIFATTGKTKGSEEIFQLKGAIEYVKATAAVGFSYNGYFYTTVLLSDKDKFCAEIAKSPKFDKSWKTEDGVEYNGNLAVVDDQLWICSNNSGMTQNIKTLMSLSEAESFLKHDYCPTLEKAENAVEMYASINQLMNDAFGFAQQAQIKLVMNLILSSPKYIVGNMNFSKTGGEFEASILNGDLKPAKCELDFSKIDPKVVASLGGNANTIMAISISDKLVKQLTDFGKSMGGALPVDIAGLLNPLDGTIAVASSTNMSNRIASEPNFKAVVTTNGNNNALLSQVLGSFGSVDIQGQTFIVSNGRYGEGAFDVAKTADKFKDAWMALAVCNQENGRNIKAIVTLQPSDGSIKLKAEVEMK